MYWKVFDYFRDQNQVRGYKSGTVRTPESDPTGQNRHQAVMYQVLMVLQMEQ